MPLPLNQANALGTPLSSTSPPPSHTQYEYRLGPGFRHSFVLPHWPIILTYRGSGAWWSVLLQLTPMYERDETIYRGEFR